MPGPVVPESVLKKRATLKELAAKRAESKKKDSVVHLVIHNINNILPFAT